MISHAGHRPISMIGRLQNEMRDEEEEDDKEDEAKGKSQVYLLKRQAWLIDDTIRRWS